MIFLKAGSSIVPSGEEFKLPSFSSDVHHECEVALQFGSNLEFSGLTISLDLTARDIQNKLKAQAHPWTLAKSFKASCALGPIVAIEKASKARLDLNDLEFKLTVGGELRQHGHTRDMIHDIEKLRRYVVERFPVVPGDLLLTGTPVGVAALKPGDEIHAEILNLVKAHWRVARN
jgi:2-keto-4-pentenoate hydratase/2-oxohepta-3-ene-1,7-dioic acid hydratase in catechol pathway